MLIRSSKYEILVIDAEMTTKQEIVMNFPDFVHPWRESAQLFISQKVIQTILFSSSTYQVEVKLPTEEESFWVFIQLDDVSHVRDIFCSCASSSQKGSCIHMAVATEGISLSSKTPIHTRFEKSFWKTCLYQLFEKALSDPFELKIQQKGQPFSLCYTQNEVSVFEASARESLVEEIQTIFINREEETEENSIKFSNISEEEIDRWKAGHPSLELRWELSPFADFAKWLFLHEEQGNNIRVIWIEQQNEPVAIEIVLTHGEIRIALDQEMIACILPYLHLVNSNLPIRTDYYFEPLQVDFDTQKSQLTIFRKKKIAVEDKAKTIGSWLYFAKHGFVKHEAHVKEKEVLSSTQEIEEFLEHTTLDWKVPINKNVQKLNYHLSVSSKGELTIEAYREKEDDIAPPNGILFDEWIYRENYGFERVELKKFNESTVVLAHNKLSHFLSTHRGWLSQFAGFHVHHAQQEHQIIYKIDKDGHLHFTVEKKERVAKKKISCGDWSYVPGEGFYPEDSHMLDLPIPIDKVIARHLVAEFIRNHLAALSGIEMFFAQECPIQNVFLQIELKKPGVITVFPSFEWKDRDDKKHALFYDEFIYIPKKGFSMLPARFRPIHYIREVRSQNPVEWNEFFAEVLPHLEKEYECIIDPRLKKAENIHLIIDPKENTDGSWNVQASWKNEHGEVLLHDIQTAKKNDIRFLPTKIGFLDLSDDRFQWLSIVPKQNGKNGKKDGTLTLSSSDLLQLSAFEKFTIQEQPGSESKKVLERFLTLAPENPPVYPDLICDLRPYQKNGVEWLWYLFQNKFSGLLCDDMGVGKTHQAMALMSSVRENSKKNKAIFLIVCPTSLIYHWQDKIAKFLPKFKIKIYANPGRTLDDFPGNYQVLLTTYGVVRNEIQKLKKYHFDVSFFDELQIAKNHVSQIHAALLQINSHMKVGLTGTPIENQLRELKALFDLIMPGYMLQENQFREFFIRPIERGDTQGRKTLLARLIKPFVLRRKKSDVLPELPEKTEELAVAELKGEQKNLYKSVASHQANWLIQQLSDEANPIPYMHIFSLLMSLKQICNHPACYLKDIENYERYESGKWDVFCELLQEALDSEQKIVIFSQYLAMLDIIKLHLTKNGIKFAEIRGQTRQRGDQVAKFQDDPECRVFLGSLQAAGLGIDLTSASVVIHYDRWWNAARENQATDRVHRIGQVRGVQVFKLMTEGTIEEKIDNMILKKSNLLEDVVSIDDHKVVKRLSRQEIISLLEGLSG